ncbi:hypothetical protein HGRIS_005697 [Hohenbuehelia grisea]|uniref:NmrA-like domain-containing protein n=1 Tax=Hohenbuehelia grisea TaxID=104357 RepID=A0ABR3JZG5_9AGAR
MPRRNILVTGATGRQGHAAVRALVSGNAVDPDADLHVLALTRKSSSPKARALASDHVTVVEGNLDDPESAKKLFQNAQTPIWGVLCILAFPGLGASAEGEEKQGKAKGVGEWVDENHRAKLRIEEHVQSLGAKGLPWTIIRPGFFMENYEGTIGSITVAVLKAGLKADTALQLILSNFILKF